MDCSQVKRCNLSRCSPTPLEVPSIPLSALSLQQRVILNIVKTHLRQSSEDQLDNPIRVIVLGSGGTGKSEICSHLRFELESQKQKCQDFEFLMGAYTGIAANQIKGGTIHRSFGIPSFVKHDDHDAFVRNIDLNSDRALYLRRVQFIVFDEMNFIGQRMFYLIDSLLKHVDRRYSHLPFSGRSVVLLGDIFQLAPANDRAIFTPAGKTSPKYAQEAFQLYRKFDTHVFIMRKPFRQLGNS
ncbi:unnamed protein product, partial [Allacma fusca]